MLEVEYYTNLINLHTNIISLFFKVLHTTIMVIIDINYCKENTQEYLLG